MHTEIHIAPQQDRPILLKEYAIGIFNTIPTKTSLRKAIDKKLIMVNGKPGTTLTYITGGEEITYSPPPETTAKKQLLLPLEVLFEDEYIAVVHKPPGILVNGNTFETVDNALPQNLTKSTLPDAVRPRPVHRLDYGTSGLLLIGKTSQSIISLSKMLEHKEITKSYYAITVGPMKDRGTINEDVDDRSAISHFRVEKSVFSTRFECLNLVRLYLETGRRHQLRKHLASIGNPILGDQEYGIIDKILIGKGIYLHAYSLSFVHPFTNEAIHIEKSLPKKFLKIFNDNITNG